MADAPRARKLAKRISQIVASALEHEVKDPRLARVTITDTRVTGDLHEATIYYTVIGDKLDAEPDHAGVAEALDKAKGKLRTLVGQGTGVRFTPSLAFVADTVPDVARGIDDLLAKARAADAEVAAQASRATPAGEADPYKAPRPRDEDDEDDQDDDED
ncbi:30S ribosome-binding factor RbfA [Actinokineospora bangkokensis]|uniref:Ribosome-binding factor A n=1 Tax=Actinokineospora bangkokensis TaxID=1193682 RepID=A0A1Q9LQ08_9PSEU|nr:30S ribosome-binding factor RbfA [Actinokineospora bangkokensis]OLR94110.1 ribosome-binding factor A [Actinokineospora bangkokensis]